MASWAVNGSGNDDEVIAEKPISALLVCEAGQSDVLSTWSAKLKAMKIPVVPILNKVDLLIDAEREATDMEQQCDIRPIMVNEVETGYRQCTPGHHRGHARTLTHRQSRGSLVEDGDLVRW